MRERGRERERQTDRQTDREKHDCMNWKKLELRNGDRELCIFRETITARE